MHQTGLSPDATAGPLRLGITLDTILPPTGSNGRGKTGLAGQLHRRILAVLGNSAHPMTVWDLKRAIYGTGITAPPPALSSQSHTQPPAESGRKCDSGPTSSQSHMQPRSQPHKQPKPIAKTKRGAK